MKIGPAVRRVLSPAMERRASGWYRSVFVDLAKVASVLADVLPRDARVLDIGGGDGELLNLLFARRPDLHVTMVDVAPSVGRFVLPEHAARVAFHPGVLVEDHIATLDRPYDAALVSDVMHHLPLDYRGPFLRSVQSGLRPGGAIYVKDIEPGAFIASLSLFCDMHISGDKGVVLVSQDDLRQLAADSLPPHEATELGLITRDAPNYLVQLLPLPAAA